MQAGFVGDTLSWREQALPRWGRKARARVARARAAKSIRSFVLGGLVMLWDEVKKLHIDCWGKVVPAAPRTA